MERPFHREDYQNGRLTICFTDAAHLTDSWNFARKHGRGADFALAMMQLISVALGATLPQRECVWPDGDVSPAKPGTDHKITISPDSHTAPSFLWQEEKGMVGGLIWHHRSGDWSIHT
jgi:hypothetical protein